MTVSAFETEGSLSLKVLADNASQRKLLHIFANFIHTHALCQCRRVDLLILGYRGLYFPQYGNKLPSAVLCLSYIHVPFAVYTMLANEIMISRLYQFNL